MHLPREKKENKSDETVWIRDLLSYFSSEKIGIIWYLMKLRSSSLHSGLDARFCCTFATPSFLLCVKKRRRFPEGATSTQGKIKQKPLYCRADYCLNRKNTQKRLIRHFKGHSKEKNAFFRIFKRFQEKTQDWF